MKYVIILGDGMADEPIPVLGGKTPLEYAKRRPWTGWQKCPGSVWFIRFRKGCSRGAIRQTCLFLGYDPKNTIPGPFTSGGFKHRRAYGSHGHCSAGQSGHPD